MKNILLEEFHSKVPVNKMAAKVVYSKGDHFEPNKNIRTADSTVPLPIADKEKIRFNKKNPNFQDLTGISFGRFVVLGLSAIKGNEPLWVVRCNCGIYSARRKKAILNPNNKIDCCERCRHLLYLKKAEYFRRTGKDDKEMVDFF